MDLIIDAELDQGFSGAARKGQRCAERLMCQLDQIDLHPLLRQRDRGVHAGDAAADDQGG
jgi:hypothetical protein